MAIFQFCLKMLCTKRGTLCSKQLLPWVGNTAPPTCLSHPTIPSCLGWRTFQGARGPNEGGSGDFPSFSYSYYFILIRVKINWGLKVSWCPEIKILIDLLRQDALCCHSQGRPQSAPRVSEGLVRLHRSLPGSKKHISIIFVLATQIHGNRIITESLFGGGNVLGQLRLHFNNNNITLM